MRYGNKIGRNHPCPCGTKKKYKRCCWGKTDWLAISKAGDSTELVKHLSGRGKNLLFLGLLADALQLDRRRVHDIQDFKRAFTPEAVRKIFEGVGQLWYDGTDVERVLRQERETTSGLYVGMYDPMTILRGITRHALYSHRILMIDPFMNPRFVRDEYNPLNHPEQHRASALQCAWLWFQMAPWIDADLVHFIRTPGDFNLDLQAHAHQITLARYERYPELKRLLDAEVADDRYAGLYEKQMMLSLPDSYYRQVALQEGWVASAAELDRLIVSIQEMRRNHPLVLEPLTNQSAQLLQLSSGASYEMAKLTASITGSHVITDIGSRWAEIGIDRREAEVETETWTSFAKAFGGIPFKYLDIVPIEAALKLRREERLRDLRSCLGKAWRACRDEDEFSETNVATLANELQEQIREAEAEWMEIKASLTKILGAELLAGGISAAALIGTGTAQWAAGGVVTAAASNALAYRWKKKAYGRKYPASFFLSLAKGSKHFG